jgi:hypothetical protein
MLERNAKKALPPFCVFPVLMPKRMRTSRTSSNRIITAFCFCSSSRLFGSLGLFCVPDCTVGALKRLAYFMPVPCRIFVPALTYTSVKPSASTYSSRWPS